MPTLENLNIEITANTQTAVASIQRLSGELTNLSNSLAQLNLGNLKTLSDSLLDFGTSVQLFSSEIKTTDINKIAKDLQKLGNVDSNLLSQTASAMSALGNEITKLGSIAEASEGIASMVKALGQFGGEKVQRSISALPALANGFVNFMNTVKQAPEASRNMIDFTNALANLTSNGSKVGSAVKGLSSNVEKSGKTFKNTSRHARTLASAIGLMYAKYALAFRGIKKLFSEIKGTSDYLEAFNFLQVTTGKVGAEYYKEYGYETADAYADAFRDELNTKFKQMSGITLDLDEGLIKSTNVKSLGLNLKEITQYSAELTSMTNSLGMTGEVSLATSKALTMLSADLGSLKNLDYSAVSKNLESALMGQSRAVYKYGIDLTNASLANYALANGITKSVSEMSQQEKAQLRLLALLDQSKVAWGDLANTINSPSNMIRQLKNNLTELGTVIGQLFIPVLQKVLPWVNGLTLALKNLMVNVAEILGIKLNLDDFGTGYSESLEEIADSYDDVTEASKKAKTGIRAFDELTTISANKNNGNDGLSDQIDLSTQILEAVGNYEKVWDEAYKRMTSKAQEIAEVIGNALEPIKKIIKDFAIGDFFTAGKDISHLVADISNFIMRAIWSVDWEKIGHKIGDFIKGIDWKAMFIGIENIIGAALQAAIDLWRGAFDAAPFETALISAFAVLKFTGLGSILFNQVKTGLMSKLGDETEVSKMLTGLKQNLQKIGVGAILISVGIGLELDDIKAVNSGEYRWDSVQSVLKTIASSALIGGGSALMLSALGVSAAAAGVVGLIVLAVGVIASLIMKKAVQPSETETQMALKKALDAWVIESSDRTKEVEASIQLRVGNVDAENANLESIAQKVWDMSNAFDSLTDGERELLKYYSDELIQLMPDLAGQIDTVTGAYKGTREELDRLITKTEEYAYAQAYSENLKDNLIEYSKKQKDYDKAYDERIRYENQYWELRGQILAKIKESGADDKEANRMLSEALTAFNNGKSYTVRHKLGFGRASIFDISASDFKSADGNFNQIKGKMYALQTETTTLGNEMNQLAYDITYWESKYSDTMTKIGEDSVGGLEKAVELTKTNLKNLNDVFKKSKVSVEAKNTMYKVIKSITDTLDKGEKPTKEQVEKLYKSINSGFAELNKGNIPQNIKDVLDTMWGLIQSGSDEGYQKMLNLSTQLLSGFKDSGLDTTMSAEIQSGIDGIDDTVDKNQATINQSGQKISGEIGKGITDNSEAITESIEGAVTNATTKAFSSITSGSPIDLKIASWVTSIKARIESAMGDGAIDISNLKVAGTPYMNPNQVIDSNGNPVAPIGNKFDLWNDLNSQSTRQIELKLKIEQDPDAIVKMIVDANNNEIKKTGNGLFSASY